MQSGNLRVSIARLRAREKLDYWIFIRFGMSSFEGKKLTVKRRQICTPPTILILNNGFQLHVMS